MSSCTSPDPPDYCSAVSPELKLYQAFIFSVPVFFTFVLLLFFYLFYLWRRRANWHVPVFFTFVLLLFFYLFYLFYKLAIYVPPMHAFLKYTWCIANLILECGINKEMREMLPVVIFKESFLIRKHSQCSICLADYQADERLQRIPPCGHTFHIDCIDHWFSKNTTCPLCRVSLLTAPRAASVAPTDLETQAIEEDCSSNAQHHVGLRDEHTRPEDQAVDGRISDGPSQQTNVEASVVVVIATQTAGSPSSCHLSDV
ncbi:RING-H2 finger protein ATL7-like [Triticum dicoccoides]|uniref:RING-H2 finger protein ATL7-like n=1 Tax=Triticum dicoccoides TaxID=85692 RepID=UPI0018918A20|nr:RING-H2 finger protein ATL7-like [Triticum dicoccoides]XP_044405637.1 RING-H2 finger protein ATL7-like [Triticum aestivum]